MWKLCKRGKILWKNKLLSWKIYGDFHLWIFRNMQTFRPSLTLSGLYEFYFCAKKNGIRWRRMWVESLKHKPDVSQSALYSNFRQLRIEKRERMKSEIKHILNEEANMCVCGCAYIEKYYRVNMKDYVWRNCLKISFFFSQQNLCRYIVWWSRCHRCRLHFKWTHGVLGVVGRISRWIVIS